MSRSHLWGNRGSEGDVLLVNKFLVWKQLLLLPWHWLWLESSASATQDRTQETELEERKMQDWCSSRERREVAFFCSSPRLKEAFCSRSSLSAFESSFAASSHYTELLFWCSCQNFVLYNTGYSADSDSRIGSRVSVLPSLLPWLSWVILSCLECTACCCSSLSNFGFSSYCVHFSHIRSSFCLPWLNGRATTPVKLSLVDQKHDEEEDASIFLHHLLMTLQHNRQ
jgi:hypothetical protein